LLRSILLWIRCTAQQFVQQAMRRCDSRVAVQLVVDMMRTPFIQIEVMEFGLKQQMSVQRNVI